MPKREEIGSEIVFLKMQILTVADAQAKANKRVIESVKRYPVLLAYTDTLEFVFSAFYLQGGHVIYVEHLKSSEFNPIRLHGKRVANLIIGAKDRKDPMDIIWSVLHEWGHLLQTPQTEEIRLNPQLTYYRERDAWDKAETKFKEYPALAPFLGKFYAYRDFCLNDYNSKISNNKTH
jgi:hypothetical protein